MLIVTIAAAVTFFSLVFVHAGNIGLPDNKRLWTAFLAYLVVRGGLLAIWGCHVFTPQFISRVKPAKTLEL